VRRHLARRAGSEDRAHLEDLTQEACVRLLRALRRESAEDLDALAFVIAQRTWVDFVRRRTRWRRVFAGGEERDAMAAAEESEWAGSGERLRFIVLALFEREGRDACRELALAYFAEMDWKTVAAAFNQSHAAVRKRWSRCVEDVRRLLAQDRKLSRLLHPGEA